MTIDTNDPRLTAYALNELDDADRGEVERLLAESPDARTEVEAIRAAAARLTEELAAEPMPGAARPTADVNIPGETGEPLRLSDEDRKQIEARALAMKLRRWIPTAIAASILLVCGLSFSMYSSGLNSARDKSKDLSNSYMIAMNDGSTPANSVDPLANIRQLGYTTDTVGEQAHEPSVQVSGGFKAGENTSGGSVANPRQPWFDSSGSRPEEDEHSLAADMSPGPPADVLDLLTESGALPGQPSTPSASSPTSESAYAHQYQHSPSGGGAGAQARVQVSDLEIDTPAVTLSKKGTDVFAFDANVIVAREEPMWADARNSISAEAQQGGHAGAQKISAGRADDAWVYHDVNRDRDGKPPDADAWWNRPRDGHPPIPENTGEAYNRILDNPFLPALQNPLSTFSIDVDTASYSNIRRILTANQLPPPDAVRIEEMVNYFTYDYDGPTGDHPFAVHLETAACPWDVEHRLVRVGLKGREIERENRPACNLVFLIDVSGSMDCPNRLPLVKQALAMLTQQLTPADRVAMVVYAGASGLALPSTPAGEKQKILDALDNLQAGGCTNGGQGIELAYDIAGQYLNKEGVNRVILATDGDFNVGITDREKLIKLITDKAKGGVFLSVLGFGMGNLKDATLEQLADKGNGHYAYIDTFAEAKKVLVDEIGSTLVTIAKDVKIQIEFNPAQVAAYRLIGYENRILAARDFNNDKKDAGEIGAGHTVTALYEVVPMAANVKGVDSLRYQKPADAAVREEARPGDGAANKEMLTVKLRYKQPTSDTSTLIEVPLVDGGGAFEGASPDLRFASAVAGIGMILRNSPHKGDLNYENVIAMAVNSMGRDPSGQRSEFIDLVRKAKTLSGR